MEFPSNTSIVIVSAVSYFILLLLSASEPTSSHKLIESKSSFAKEDKCICAQEMMAFTSRRRFCGAELLSEFCDKNGIYNCQPGNNLSHEALKDKGSSCSENYWLPDWCGLRCKNNVSSSCTPQCMDIERADQSYRKIYKYYVPFVPDYTPWGNKTPHIWIV